MCWKGLEVYFPCSFGDQKFGQQLFQLLPYRKTPVIWGMDASRLVGKLSGDLYFGCVDRQMVLVWAPRYWIVIPELHSQPYLSEYQAGEFNFYTYLH